MTTMKLLIVILALITLFCIGTVSATEVTMQVNSKHIIGSGLGNSPFDLDSCINVVYVISEMKEDTCGNCYALQEYPVSIQDYCSINTGQTVTLEVPDSRLDACKVVKIE